MVIHIGPGNARDFHPRFMSLMNHYVVEPFTCIPAAGWEKGQVDNQVSTLRNQLFKPQWHFDDLSTLNTHLLACCHAQGGKPHVRALGRPFHGYIEARPRSVQPVLFVTIITITAYPLRMPNNASLWGLMLSVSYWLLISRLSPSISVASIDMTICLRLGTWE